MKANDDLCVINGMLQDGDAVYSLSRQARLTGLRGVIDTILDFFILGGGIGEIADSMTNRWYLIVSGRDAKIIQVSHAVVQSTIILPEWKQSWKSDFKKVVLGEYKYSKISKIR